MAASVATLMSMMTLAGCAPSEYSADDYAQDISARGFVNVELDKSNSNSHILNYHADIPCDPFGLLAVDIRVNATFDRENAISEIAFFDTEVRELPNGTAASNLTVEDLRQHNGHYEIQNCLASNSQQ